MSVPQDDPAEPSTPTPLHRPARTLWQRLGGEGLALSILVHGILVVIAIVWVVSTVTDTTGKKDPNTFATGSGGGSGSKSCSLASLSAREGLMRSARHSL